ncbi:hypothetical protein AVEN_274487-1 [Araneus ventricosus]|uniref:Uncharacterized protein n=1 Tax=Araneus ventricosus TaxID=182803 RepID=A0A4Y2IJJ5_ARAVE|nr:hypothetical protein AVEN_274487-1 [Araneus ventricosus]
MNYSFPLVAMIKTCADSTYGCCPDDQTAALGPNNAGCPTMNMVLKCRNCVYSKFFCTSEKVNKMHNINAAMVYLVLES